MALERRYNKITDFLREEFDKIKIYEKDKKFKSSLYKQKKLVERAEKLLQKVDSMLKIESLQGEIKEELRSLQQEIKRHLE